MPNSDHDLVNFEQDYELNYILRKYGKQETTENRNILCTYGAHCKNKFKTTLSNRSITHAEFYSFLKNDGYLNKLS